MIWVSDKEGKIVHASEEWERITGQPVVEGLGDGWHAMLHHEDLPIILPIFRAATRAKSPFTVQYRLRSVVEGFLWVVVGAVPSLGPPDDEFLGFLGSITKIEAGAISRKAGGRLGAFNPPEPHDDTLPHRPLDLIADYLLLAHALVLEAQVGQTVLPPLRRAMLRVAVELAEGEKQLKRPRH